MKIYRQKQKGFNSLQCLVYIKGNQLQPLRIHVSVYVLIFTELTKLYCIFICVTTCTLINGKHIAPDKHGYQELGPVVQSVVSLIRVISLTVLADSIYNILIFFAEKM